MLPNISQIKAPRDPAANLVSLAVPRVFLQDHPHEDHGFLRIPYSLSRSPEFLCEILDKPTAHCTLRGAVPRARLADEEPPPHLLDTVVINYSIRVSTIVID